MQASLFKLVCYLLSSSHSLSTFCSSPLFLTHTVGGQLIFDGTKDVVLESRYIWVMDGGSFRIGSSSCHFTKKVAPPSLLLFLLFLFWFLSPFFFCGLVLILILFVGYHNSVWCLRQRN